MALSEKFFFDVQHARDYLCDSIVRHNGVPVWVTSVDRQRGKYKVAIVPTYFELGREGQVVFLEELDLSPIPLGMCNLTERKYHGFWYLQRMNVRRWKVGLSRSNTYHWSQGIDADWDTVFASKGFLDMVNGKYPNYREAYWSVKGGPGIGAMAFARGLAVVSRDSKNDLRIMSNRGKNVGSAEENGIRLYEPFFHLTQVIEQEGVKCLF